MPRRDPKTGKYVSGSDVDDWSDVRAISGTLSSTIPAADLAGGTGNSVVGGEESEVIDFSNVLANDEVLEVMQLQMVTSLSAPTTATAESAVFLNYVLRGDLGEGAGQHPVHYGFGTHVEENAVDIRQSQYDDNDRLVTGHMPAENSHSDSATGLAAGADAGFDRVDLDFGSLGAGPNFDADDEIGIPHSIYYDNVSDHAVLAHFDVHLFGQVHEV